MSQRRKLERHQEQMGGVQVGDLTPEERRKVRPALVRGLLDSGALIFHRELTGGHKLYIVMPGDTGEVKDEHCATVWAEIAAALQLASENARLVGALPTSGANVTKGGTS